MITKLNLLKSATARFENNPEYMAYILKKYCEFERISESELLSEFNCSADDYYKLALCKYPPVDTTDFSQRLKVISEYTHIKTDDLNMLIKHVNTVLIFIGASANTLMAARDREKKKDDKDEIQ